MAQIDKTIVEGFAKGVSNDVILEALQGAETLIENALDDMSKVNPHITKNFEILPVGAFNLGAVLASSTLDVLLVINDPQIELNTNALFKNKWQTFKNRLVWAWKNRKKKKKRKRKKKKGSEEVVTSLYVNHKDDYNLSFFSQDLVNFIAKFITQEDIVFIRSGKVFIQGNNLPFTICITPVFKKEENEFLFYHQSRKNLFNFSLEKYNKNTKFLLENFGENYLKQVRIFTGLYEHLTQTKPQGFLIESLLANLPEIAFESEDVFENFLICSNLLINSKTNKLFSISNPSKKIFEDPLCQTSLIDITNFLRKLSSI